MNEDKKIILIKGGKSGWFEQAIFILKDKGQRKNMPKNFVEEAEKIINNYMIKKYSNGTKLNSAYSQTKPKDSRQEIKTDAKKRGKRKKYDKILNISVILCCVLIGLILYYFG
ncbi:MAG: hypothetical protein HFE59_04960 [Clostridiales bacterium]|nr:hypothetical protein [Clostridiales bacterium]